MINGMDVFRIPLKMKAWLDLKEKKAQGTHVNSRDIRKRRLDVFRLFPLVRELRSEDDNG